MNMILSLYSLKESWVFFQESIDSLSVQQKEIRMIATIAFSAIAFVYLIHRCRVGTHAIEFKNDTKINDLSDSTTSESSHAISELKKWTVPSLSDDNIESDDSNVPFDDVARFVSTKETPYINEDDKEDTQSNTNDIDLTAQCKLSEFYED